MANLLLSTCNSPGYTSSNIVDTYTIFTWLIQEQIKPQDYKGYEISLILNLPINNQRKFKGFIVDVISSDLHLKVNEIVEKIPLSNISRANLIPVFE